MPIHGGFHDYPPVLDRLFISLGGLVGVGFETDPPEMGVELAGGHPGGPFDYLFDDEAGGFIGEVGGTGDDYPDPAQVDLPGR